MGDKIKVYQDGKLCRDRIGVILKQRANQVLIEFTINEYIEVTDSFVDVTKPRWFRRRRRDKGGIYECVGWNYWFYKNDVVYD